MLVALLRVPFGGKDWYAALHSTGRWFCEEPTLRGALDALCDPSTREGPAGGFYGSDATASAVEKFGATVVYHTPQGGPAGRVY